MKILFAILSVSFYLSSFSQKINVEEKVRKLGFTSKQIIFKKDTIHFLILSDSFEIQKKKPLLIFCQGSQPIPVLVHDKYGVYPPLPFQPNKYFHIVIISKPGIPIYPDSLNESHFYLEDGKIPLRYTQHNNLYYYASITNKVINYLYRQPYIDNTQIFIFGHSQGSRIAARVVRQNKKVTKLVVASTNPYSRFHGFISENRWKSLKDPENADNYQRKVDSVYEEYKKVINSKENTKDFYGNDDIKSWYSFTEPPLIKDLLQCKIPVLLIYGTADLIAIDNDKVPLEFIRKRKNNLTVKPYINLDHNFFEIKIDGLPNYDKPHWGEVGTHIFEWLKRK